MTPRFRFCAAAAGALILSVLSIALFRPTAALADQCPQPLPDAVGDAAVVHQGYDAAPETYVDIIEAWVHPAADYPAMELGLKLTEPVPFRPQTNFNAFFFFDADGNLLNNAETGTRAGADTAFSLTFGLDRPSWKTSVWTYDPDTGEWTDTANPKILYAFLPDGLMIHVPFDLFPEDVAWPWRAAVAVGNEGADRGDALPDGEGMLVSCGPGGEPKVASGVPSAPPPEVPPAPASPTVPKDEMPWWVYLWAGLLMAGVISMAVKAIRQSPPEVPPPTEPDKEKDSCDCPWCRLFIVIGDKDNAAIGSAANLGKAIKRDTAAAADIGSKDRCLKVAHFTDYNLTRGRYVRSGASGEMEWEDFRNRSLAAADGYGQVCVWEEVMLVHHGESEGRVKRIMTQFQTLIPSQPIVRLVLYYCGGEGTLPKREFEAMARNLGLRLRQIPEKCRPERVDIYLAPTIAFGGKEHFTKLVLEQTGLISYEGKMKHYSVNQDGVMTEHGNEAPPGGQLFGSVPLGRLGTSSNLDAEAYAGNWREIAKLPLSEIKRYRQRITEAKLDDPQLTPKESQEQAYRRLLGEERASRLSEAEWDELVEIKDKGEAGRWLKRRFG